MAKPKRARSTVQRPRRRAKRGGARAGVTWRSGPFATWSSGKTTSGERVNPASAMGLSSYYAGIRNIAEDIAKLPKSVVERLERGRRVLDDHPVTRILHEEFNPFCDAFTGVQTMTQWAIGHGNALAEIELNEAGVPIALWPIHPSRVSLRFEGGEPVFLVSVDDVAGRYTKPQPYRTDEVFHLRNIGDQWQGWSPAQVHAETIGLGLAARGFAAAFFGNDTSIGAVVSLAGRVPKPDREAYRADLNQSYQGARKSHGVLILDGDAKISRLGLPPQDAQFIETQEWTLEDVARILRCPPHKLGHLKRASGWSTLEASNTDYAVDTLMPWTVRWEKEAKRKLLRPQPRHSLVIFFQGLLRGDFKTRSDGYRSLIQGGVMTPNEARAFEDMNPSDDPGADSLWMQGAMAPMRRLMAPPAPPPPPASPSDPPADPPTDGEPPPDEQKVAARVQTEAVAERIGRKVEAAAARHAAKHAGDAPAFQRWARSFSEGLREELIRGLAPVLGDRAALWAAARAPDLNRLILERFASGEAVQAADVAAVLSVDSVMEIL